QGTQGQQGQQAGATGESGKSDLSGSSTFGQAPAGSETTAPTAGMKGIRITASPNNNTLVIKATAREYRQILAILRDIDGPGVQVMINTTIAEVVLNDELKYGVQAYLKSHNVSGGVFNGNGDTGLSI